MCLRSSLFSPGEEADVQVCVCVCGWFVAAVSMSEVWLTVSACLWLLVCSAPNTNMIRLTNSIAQAISPPVLQYNGSVNEGA